MATKSPSERSRLLNPRANPPRRLRPGFDYDIIEDGKVYRIYDPILMLAAWLWYMIFTPAAIGLAAVSLRDIAEKNHLGENWRLDCALKLTIIAGIIAACGLPMLIGILTVTKTHLMSLAAFLILIISFLQVATMVMFEIAMHKSNAISICEATLSLLPYKCWQISVIEGLVGISFYPFIHWAALNHRDLLANLKHMLTFTVPRWR